ncbi:unnamed protein product [Polarella glacialis]|uniref:Uncharacterized protein n=1 Tax=Polarella glacialis TaxID=89957 RepID=A0A813HX08_POLGL|nr:unnamed protein product [Polarella glacialis]
MFKDSSTCQRERAITPETEVSLWYLEECLRLLGPLCASSQEVWEHVDAKVDGKAIAEHVAGDARTHHWRRTANNWVRKAAFQDEKEQHQDSLLEKDSEQMGEDARSPMAADPATLDHVEIASADEVEDRHHELSSATAAGAVELLSQVLMYYATVIIKLVRAIGQLVTRSGRALADQGTSFVAACAVVQLLWLCRAQLSLRSAARWTSEHLTGGDAFAATGLLGDEEPLLLLERELWELVADSLTSLAAMEVSDVPWPLASACDDFTAALRKLSSREDAEEVDHQRGVASLLSQLEILHRGPWDTPLLTHELLLRPWAGGEAAEKAWALYARAANVESSRGLGSSALQAWPSGPAERRSALQAKRARAGRAVASAAWLRGQVHEADRLLAKSFDLAVEAQDLVTQKAVLADACEVRARHAESMCQAVPTRHGEGRVFAFSVEQYAEYCQALELCREASSGSASSGSREVCPKRSTDATSRAQSAAEGKGRAPGRRSLSHLARLEMKLGVHLLHFADTQDNLVESTPGGSGNGNASFLPAPAGAFGGALSGVGFLVVFRLTFYFVSC